MKPANQPRASLPAAGPASVFGDHRRRTPPLVAPRHSITRLASVTFSFGQHRTGQRPSRPDLCLRGHAASRQHWEWAWRTADHGTKLMSSCQPRPCDTRALNCYRYAKTGGGRTSPACQPGVMVGSPRRRPPPLMANCHHLHTIIPVTTKNFAGSEFLAKPCSRKAAAYRRSDGKPDSRLPLQTRSYLMMELRIERGRRQDRSSARCNGAGSCRGDCAAGSEIPRHRRHLSITQTPRWPECHRCACARLNSCLPEDDYSWLFDIQKRCRSRRRRLRQCSHARQTSPPTMWTAPVGAVQFWTELAHWNE